jgi:cell division protein FtsB
LKAEADLAAKQKAAHEADLARLKEEQEAEIARIKTMEDAKLFVAH